MEGDQETPCSYILKFYPCMLVLFSSVNRLVTHVDFETLSCVCVTGRKSLHGICRWRTMGEMEKKINDWRGHARMDGPADASTSS